MLRMLALGAAVAGGQPGKKPKPLNPGPIFGFALLVVIGIVSVAGYTHHLTVGLLIIAPIICAAIVLVGAVAHSLPPKTGGSADSIPRMKQVYALMSASCPVCHARPGATCTKVGTEPMAIVDTQWNTRCHFKRMERAVQYHMVTRDEMIAQWDGNVPEGLHI